MTPRHIDLAVCFLPLITIHVSFIIAASHNHIEWCIPYGMDCSSISATGRNAPEKYWFKPMMTGSAVLMFFYWYLNVQYLKLLNISAPKRIITIAVLGTFAPMFLILYTTFLGEQGDLYRQLRKTGITFSFTFSYLCQLLFTTCIIQHTKASLNMLWAFRLNIFILGLGILSLALDVILGKTYDRLENGFEWSFASFMAVHSYLIAKEWKEKDFKLKLNI